MASNEYRLVRIPKKHGGNHYSHVNHLISCYQKPTYTKSGSNTSSDVTLLAAGLPQQITAMLNNAETIEDQEGSKHYFAVFNNESGRDWSELTLLDTRQGLASFKTWASGINPDGSSTFEDPLRGIPKGFKDYIGYSPIIVLAIRRPQGSNLFDAGDHIKELLSNSTEIEASIAKALIEDIAVPQASEHEEDEASGGEGDENSDDDDDGTSDDDEDDTSGDEYHQYIQDRALCNLRQPVPRGSDSLPSSTREYNIQFDDRYQPKYDDGDDDEEKQDEEMSD